MADRIIALAAPFVAAAVLLLMAMGLLPLIVRAEWGAASQHGLAALRFTLLQAVLSAAVSCVLAVPLARALMRRRFWGRNALIRVLSAPFVLPVLAAVMGLLALFGTAGPINELLRFMGISPLSIYGLGGVVMAHVFLNLPLATRMVMQGWSGIPTERFRLAQGLSFGNAALFRHLEWPMLRAILPGIFSAIFLICLTSFAVALTLGGGPRATTVELGIYQALRFQFDLGQAARLALMQVALGLLGVLIVTMAWKSPGLGAGLDRALPVAAPKGWGLAQDVLVITALSAFLILPIAQVVHRGAAHVVALPHGFWGAAIRSISIALASAFLAGIAALALARARAKGAGIWAEIAAMLPLGTSSLALGTGAFLAILPVFPPQTAAVFLAVIFNAAFALPFLFRILLPACRDIEAGYGRLAAQLGLGHWAEMRVLFLPRLRRPIGFGAGLAAAMAMGDFGVIALFGAQDQAVLPIIIARLMGAYQMQAAAGVTLWLIAIAFTLFWIFDAVGGGDADA